MLNSKFVEQVILKGSLPEGRFSNAEILEMASSCLRDDLGAQILALRQDYYTRSKTVPMAHRIEIPPRGFGPVIRDLRIVRGGSLIPCYMIDVADAYSLQEGRPKYFYLEDNIVVMYPKPSDLTETVVVRYFLRPSNLVTEGKAGKISNIDTTTGVLTVTPPPAFTPGSLVDIVSGQSGHKVTGVDLVPVSSTSNTMTFNVSDLPEFLKVGDYVAMAGESPFPNVPDDALSLLIQLTVSACLDEMGTLEEAAKSDKRCDVLRLALNSTLSVRSQAEPKRQRTRLI